MMLGCTGGPQPGGPLQKVLGKSRQMCFGGKRFGDGERTLLKVKGVNHQVTFRDTRRLESLRL